MLHTFTDPINIHWKGEICSPSFLRLIEGIYAYGTVKATGCEFNAAFLLRTGRKPSAADLDLFERLKTTIVAPLAIYQSNYDLYCSQLVHLRCGLLPPSSNDIKQAYRDIYGYPPTDDSLHVIGRQARLRRFDLAEGYFTANLWQLMEVAACLDYMGIARSKTAISTIFNKIYKRTPSDAEIDAIRVIDFTKTGHETRNEIESFIKVSDTDRGREPPDRVRFFRWRRIRREGQQPE